MSETATGNDTAHSRVSDSDTAESQSVEENQTQSDSQVDIGQEKAKAYAKGRSEFISKLGFENAEALRAQLETAAKLSEEKAKTQEINSAEAQKLAKEAIALRAKLAELEPKAKQFESLQERARLQEIESAARKAGALEQAISDIRSISAQRVRWNADHSSLEVLMPGEAGELVPTGTLDELMSEFRKDKDYLFAATNKGGSGTVAGARSVPGTTTQSKPTRAPTILEIGMGRSLRD